MYDKSTQVVVHSFKTQSQPIAATSSLEHITNIVYDITFWLILYRICGDRIGGLSLKGYMICYGKISSQKQVGTF